MTDGRLTFWRCFYIPIYLPLNLLRFLLLKPLFEGESVGVEKAATFPGNEPLAGCTTDHLNPKCRTSTSQVGKQFCFRLFWQFVLIQLCRLGNLFAATKAVLLRRRISLVPVELASYMPLSGEK
jgi:hypothetical protein